MILIFNKMTEYKAKQYITTITTLIDQVVSKKININPEYQRDVVWEDERQGFFIDSIMKGISPMPIILCKNEEGNKICIDGKQRLTSLMRFQNKEIKSININDNDETEKKSFDKLSMKEKNEFLDYNIQIIEYDVLSYNDQKEIFSRIQYGKPLSHGEKIMSVFDQKAAAQFKKMCDDMYKNKLSKFKKIKDDRDDHYLFMACVIALVSSDNNKNLGNKEKLGKILKKYDKEIEKKIIELVNFSFSENLLLNSAIIDSHKNVDINRLIIVINEIYKETKICKKFTKEKYEDFVNIILNFFDKADETTGNGKNKKKAIGAGRSKKTYDELLKLFSKIKNKDNNSDSDSDNNSSSGSSSDSDSDSVKSFEKNKINLPKKKLKKEPSGKNTAK
jgi:hypothetical protein